MYSQLSVNSLSADYFYAKDFCANAAKFNSLSATRTFGEEMYTSKICGIQYNKDGTERTEYANLAGSRSIVMGAKNKATGYDQAIFGQANVLECPESIAAGKNLSALNGSKG